MKKLKNLLSYSSFFFSSFPYLHFVLSSEGALFFQMYFKFKDLNNLVLARFQRTERFYTTVNDKSSLMEKSSDNQN